MMSTHYSLLMSRTIQGYLHDFCVPLRFHLQRWPHLGIRATRVARPTQPCELGPQRLAPDERADSQLDVRSRAASLLDNLGDLAGSH